MPVHGIKAAQDTHTISPEQIMSEFPTVFYGKIRTMERVSHRFDQNC